MTTTPTRDLETGNSPEIQNPELASFLGQLLKMDTEKVLSGVSFEGSPGVWLDTWEEEWKGACIYMTYDVDISGHQIPVMYTFWVRERRTIAYTIQRLNGVDADQGVAVLHEEQGTTNSAVFLDLPGNHGHITHIHATMMKNLICIVEHTNNANTYPLRELILDTFDMLNIPEEES